MFNNMFDELKKVKCFLKMTGFKSLTMLNALKK